MEPVASNQIQSEQTGFFGRLGNRVTKAVVSWATSHAPSNLHGRSVQLQNSDCGKLIQDISSAMSRSILQNSDNTFIKNGHDEIKLAIDDLTNHVFTAFATEGIGEEELSSDQLTDHFFATIIKKVYTEFKTHPTVDTHVHFKNIAHELLHAAFPKGIEDEKLPLALRKLLGGNTFVQWIVKRNLGTDQDLSWHSLVELFATHLESIYNCLMHKPNSPKPGPEIDQFIDAIVNKIDTTSKEADILAVGIPGLNNESNAFISQFLSRLLKGNFSRQEDNELLDTARSWLLNHMRTSLQTIYSSIFTCKPGQTPHERGVEFAANIAEKAKEILPQLDSALKDIAQLDNSQALERLEGNAAVGCPKKALEVHTARIALERIFSHELQPEKIAPLLPPFLPAKTALNQIYTFLAPYLIEILSQFRDIEQKGLQAFRDLSASDITSWIDKGIDQANQLIEAKAQDKSIQPTDFAFINDLLCQGIVGAERQSYLSSKLKYIVAIIARHAIGDQGLKAPEKAIAEIINMILTEGQKAISEKSDLQLASRTILEKVISKETFNSLLPPFLRQAQFYDSIADLLKSYLQGLAAQTQKIQSTNLKLKVPELSNMLATITAKVKTAASNQKDGFTAHLLQGHGLKNLVENVLPKIVEAIVAYHVNPKDGQPSEKRTADLFLLCMGIVERGIENSSLQNTADTLISTLLPPELLDQLIPKEFAPLKIDKFLAELFCDYLKGGYEYSNTIHQLAKDHSDAQTTMLLELQKYILSHVKDYFQSKASKKKTWIEEVARQIFHTEKPDQKELLMQFTTNIYFGAIGYLFKTTSDAPGGSLLSLFGPIAKEAQALFLQLNDNEELHFSQKTIDAYTHATGKDGRDIKHLAYWATARRALDQIYSDQAWHERTPEFLHTVLTKDMAANFATTVYETVHATQKVLQQEEQKGKNLVLKEPGLENYVDNKITNALIELLKNLAADKKPLNSTLPTLLDNFIKECCKDESTEVAKIRDTLVNRLVYTVMGKLLSDKTPPLAHIRELITSYQHDSESEVSRKLIEILMPKEALDTPLAELLVSKIVQKGLSDSIAQIKESIGTITTSGKRAKEYLYSLEGMKTFVQEVIVNLDTSLDAHAQNNERKLTESIPPYIDSLIKSCILDPTTGPLIKKSLHNLIYIVLEEALTPKLGQTIPHRLGELLSKLSNDTEGVEWLKLILPESRLKALLPNFLQNVVTHENLMKWFLRPYEQQINMVKERVVLERSKPVDPRVAPFVKRSLLSHTEPTATKRGLFGFEGVVRELERTLINSQIDHPLIDATIGQVARNLEARGLFDPRFLTEALASSRDDMPTEHEFTSKSVDLILRAAFPQGKDALLVPDVVKDAVWQKITEATTRFINRLLNPQERLLFALERMIPSTTDDKALIGRRLQQVEDMRQNGAYNPKIAENCFKRYTQEAAIRNVELSVEKENLWGPIKWLKKIVLKAVTYLTVRFSLRDRFYNFIVNPQSNSTIRSILWSLLNFTLPAEAQENSKEALKQKTKKMLYNEGLAPFGLRDIMAGQFTSYLHNKSILDCI